MTPERQKKQAQHKLKMAEKKLARAHRKRGLARSGTFYPIPYVPPAERWSPDEVKSMGGSIPGGRRRRS